MRRISVARSKRPAARPVLHAPHLAFCLALSASLIPQWTWAAPPEDEAGEQPASEEPPPETSGELSDDEIAELTQKGIEAYNDEQDYATAARIFKQIFEAQPTRNNLWLYAQSVRMGGNCSAAVPLYERYIEGMEDGKSKTQVQGLIDDCNEVVDLTGGNTSETTDSPDPADTETAEGATAVQPTNTSLDTLEPIKPWYQDPLAPTLLGLGVAATAAGATLLGIADQRERSLANSSTYNEFVDKWHDEQKRAECYDSGSDDDNLGSCRDFVIAGAATIGAGAALMVGGAVRYLVLAIGNKKAEERNEQLVVEPTASTQGFGLSFSGRF